MLIVRKRQCTCPSPARLRRRGCWRRSNRTNARQPAWHRRRKCRRPEKNDGLVGLPRAIAYDPETLRLFAQVGLFDRIVDGLVQDPQVVYLNARGVKLMEITSPRSAYGYSQLGTFYQPHFEQVLFDGLAI